MQISKFWKERTANKVLLSVIIAWIVVAIIFAFYDLAISETLYNAASPVAQYVQYFGEIPGILFGLFALFTLGTNLEFNGKKNTKIFFIAEIAISVFLIYYVLNLILNYFQINFNYISFAGVPVFLGIVLVSLVGFHIFETKLSEFQKRKYLFAKVSVMTFVVAAFIVEVLKILWGRVRFRDLTAGFTNFTSWYLPQGITGGHSFPSGHAYLAWILIPLFLLFINKKGIGKWLVMGITIIYGFFISIERIIAGAHYASDVLFSAGIVIITFLIIYKAHFPEKGNSPTGKGKKRKKKK